MQQGPRDGHAKAYGRGHERYAADEIEDKSSRFGVHVAKLALGSLDDPAIGVVAQFNPKELTRSLKVPWTKQPVLTPHPTHDDRNATRSRGHSHLEFTGSQSPTLTLELLFDGFEKHTSIEPAVQAIEVMATVRDPGARKANLRRPHHCVVTWGDQEMAPFRCVIESFDVKYTMFGRAGTPLRATCTVKLVEASILSVAGPNARPARKK